MKKSGSRRKQETCAMKIDKVIKREVKEIFYPDLGVAIFYMDVTKLKLEGDFTWMDKDRVLRMNRYIREIDKLLFLGGEFLYYYGVYRWLRTKNQSADKQKVLEVKRYYGVNGKPYCKNADGFFFNISHSGTYAALAYADNDVGVDIEYMAESNLDVAKAYFHPDEYELMYKNPEVNQRELFYRIWVMKESYLKAKGTGLTVPLNTFTFSNFVYDAVVKQDGHCISDKYQYLVRVISFLDDYKMAVCKKCREEQ